MTTTGLGWPRVVETQADVNATGARPGALGWPTLHPARTVHTDERARSGSADVRADAPSTPVGSDVTPAGVGPAPGDTRDARSDATDSRGDAKDARNDATDAHSEATDAHPDAGDGLSSTVAVPDATPASAVSRETPPIGEPHTVPEDNLSALGENRSALAEAIPDGGDDTPLAAELAHDARRRLTLHGQRLPAPTRTRVMTVANQKGGVGKTTTTVNLAAALAQSGLTVLVIDIDPQGNASTALGIDHHAEVPSIYDVVVDSAPMSGVVQECPDVPGLLCAPATIDLAGAEIELVSLVARESRLMRALDTYLAERVSQGLPRVDYVLIDCPPSLGLLTVNAMVAAQEVLIPIQCEYYALEGLSQLLKNIELIQAHLNPALHVSTILLTMYDGRTRLSAQVADEVRTHFPEPTLRTTVPRSVRISEAPSHGQTVMTYDPGSSGALSYLEGARELALRGAAQPEESVQQVVTLADQAAQAAQAAVAVEAAAEAMAEAGASGTRTATKEHTQ